VLLWDVALGCAITVRVVVAVWRPIYNVSDYVPRQFIVAQITLLTLNHLYRQARGPKRGPLHSNQRGERSPIPARG
jgi:hypothetical protein